LKNSVPPLFTINAGEAGGWFVTTSVTATVCDVGDAEGAEIVTEPVYVLAARPLVLTITVNWVVEVPKVPPVGLTWSQAVALDEAVKFADPELTKAVKNCPLGTLEPIW
jgi:hypothetical protein